MINILAAIEKVEKENNVLYPVQSPVSVTSSITSNIIHTETRYLPLSQMYFSNATITINYNLNQK